MTKLSHLYGLFAIAGLLCLGAAPSAMGCGFHSLGMQFGSMHSGSMSVAVALRKAADNGVIDVKDLEAVSKRTALYIDSVRRLHDFRKALAASAVARELPESFSLGYVESYLWTRYSKAGGEIRVDVHTDGPATGEAVVLTGEPVLTEILDGELSVDLALADGLIVIDASESEKTSIRHALQATSMTNRISSQ